eukprot:6180083-Pleurochrysis_carterae.AAC.2
MLSSTTLHPIAPCFPRKRCARAQHQHGLTEFALVVQAVHAVTSPAHVTARAHKVHEMHMCCSILPACSRVQDSVFSFKRAPCECTCAEGPFLVREFQTIIIWSFQRHVTLREAISTLPCEHSARTIVSSLRAAKVKEQSLEAPCKVQHTSIL